MEKTVTYKSMFDVGDKVETHWTQNPLLYSHEACPDTYYSCAKKLFDCYYVTGVVVKCSFFNGSFLYLVEFPTGDRLWVQEFHMKRC